MLTLELDMYQACALGALVYCLGRLLVQKLPFLSSIVYRLRLRAVSYLHSLIWRCMQQEFWSFPLIQPYRAYL